VSGKNQGVLSTLPTSIWRSIRGVGGNVVTQTFHLTAAEADRDTIKQVLGVYADSCPVARSIRDSIEILSELDLTSG
jgi:uncharacterized OsmC-like protein